jgi:hypothetical protein
MSQSDKLSELGIDPATLSPEQRNVLDGLSAEEISTLASVKNRLETAGGDVQGHSTDFGVVIY